MQANEIIETRKLLGLTQTDFARLFDAHVMTISKWERGVAQPSPYQAALIHKFQSTAKLKSGQVKTELADVIVGAGIIAALIWLLSNAK